MAKTVIESIIGHEEVVERNEPFPRCPDCGHVEDAIVYSARYECPACGHGFSTYEESVTRSVEYGICSFCEREKRFDRDDGEPLLFCLECSNLVAVRFDGALRQPLDVLAADCGEERVCVPAETDRELLVARILGGMAARHGVRLGFREDLEHVLCCQDDRYFGYLGWADLGPDERPVLAQLWVDVRYRDEGMPTALVEYWCRNVIDDRDGFQVVSPSERDLELFESLAEDGRVFGKEFEVVELDD